MRSIVSTAASGGGDATDHEDVLGELVRAVLTDCGSDVKRIAAARAAIRGVLGDRGLVQIAAVIGMFNGINQVLLD